MSIRRLRLESKHKDRPIQIASPEHFTATDAGPMTSAELIEDPTYTLYCFDPNDGSAVFVQTPPKVNLDRAAFYYMDQFDHAIGLASVPHAEFCELSQIIDLPTDGIVFIHSVGRCGSTLLSKAFGAVPSVQSLSEPDDLTQLAGLHAEPWMPDAVSASIRWRCKPRRGESANQVVIKTRAEVITIAKLMIEHFPDARNLFLYRDGLAWAQSVFNGAAPQAAFDDADQNRRMQDGWAKSMPLVGEYRRDDPPLNPIEIRILAWAQCMETYVQLRDSAPFLALRYEELVEAPRATLEAVFHFCGTHVNDWNAVEATFDKDSQEGTVFGRAERVKTARALPRELRQSAIDMIARRPLLRTPDVILPGTLGHA